MIQESPEEIRLFILEACMGIIYQDNVYVIMFLGN